VSVFCCVHCNFSFCLIFFLFANCCRANTANVGQANAVEVVKEKIQDKEDTAGYACGSYTSVCYYVCVFGYVCVFCCVHYSFNFCLIFFFFLKAGVLVFV
jgi:hypothetical protein